MATTRSTLFFLLGMLGLSAVEHAYRFSVQNKRDTQQFQEGYQQLCSIEGELELIAVITNTEIYSTVSLGNPSSECTTEVCPIDYQKMSTDTIQEGASYLIIIRRNDERMVTSMEMMRSDQQKGISGFNTDLERMITEDCKDNLAKKLSNAYQQAQGEMVPLQ